MPLEKPKKRGTGSRRQIITACLTYGAHSKMEQDRTAVGARAQTPYYSTRPRKTQAFAAHEDKRLAGISGNRYDDLPLAGADVALDVENLLPGSQHEPPF